MFYRRSMPTFSDICPMHILIVAATSAELAPLKEVQQRANHNAENRLSSLITGVGAMACAQSVQNEIHQRRPDLMIQIGIAGSFELEDTLGTAVLVDGDRMGDMGVLEEDNFKDMYDLGLADPNENPFTKGFLENPLIEKLGLSYFRKCRGITVNEITTDPYRISMYKSKYSAQIESMEGAAFHYVALKNNIPFIQIRGLSNLVGERNKKNWHIKEALDSAYAVLAAILNRGI